MAIEAKLKTVDGIGTVSRGKMDPLQINFYPSAHLFAGGDTVNEFIGNTIMRQLTIFTYGWIRTQNNIHKTLETFIPKIQKELAQDHTLGGLTIDFTEVNIDEPLINTDETEALVLFEHQVLYRVLRTDPYVQA
jgi:hypothetical protein